MKYLFVKGGIAPASEKFPIDCTAVQRLHYQAEAAEALKHWANAVEAKADFGSAEIVCDLTVFNVGGNKYRLIAFVHYRRQIVFIKNILTHEEYNQGDWKL